MPMVFAAADIGSNTAHLLIATIGPGGIKRVSNQSEWLSLGQVVSHEGDIPKTLVQTLTTALLTFKTQATAMKAEQIYVFATEAVRKASNHESVLKELRKRTGLSIDLISPQREAELGLKGALLDVPMEERFVFAESGGGSVQVATCHGVEILEEVSLPIGTGVIIDVTQLTQPPTSAQIERTKTLVRNELQKAPASQVPLPILASGGVARGLWRALHPDGEPTILLDELEYLSRSVARLDLQTVSTRFGVKEKRAATLLPGSLIYLALMEQYKTERMSVSQFGVREGAILEMQQGKIVTCAP